MLNQNVHTKSKTIDVGQFKELGRAVIGVISQDTPQNAAMYLSHGENYEFVKRRWEETVSLAESMYEWDLFFGEVFGEKYSLNRARLPNRPHELAPSITRIFNFEYDNAFRRLLFRACKQAFDVKFAGSIWDPHAQKIVGDNYRRLAHPSQALILLEEQFFLDMSLNSQRMHVQGVPCLTLMEDELVSCDSGHPPLPQGGWAGYFSSDRRKQAASLEENLLLLLKYYYSLPEKKGKRTMEMLDLNMETWCLGTLIPSHWMSTRLTQPNRWSPVIQWDQSGGKQRMLIYCVEGYAGHTKTGVRHVVR